MCYCFGRFLYHCPLPIFLAVMPPTPFFGLSALLLVIPGFPRLPALLRLSLLLMLLTSLQRVRLPMSLLPPGVSVPLQVQMRPGVCVPCT